MSRLSTRENKFSAEFVKILRSQGALVYPCVAGTHSPPGWPDMIVVHHKWRGLVERKAATTKVEPIQAMVLRELRKRTPDGLPMFATVARHVAGTTIEVDVAVDSDGLAITTICDMTEFLDVMAATVTDKS